MTAPIVKAILGRTETRGECPCCGSAGMPGASCDACVRAAYQRALRRNRQLEWDAKVKGGAFAPVGTILEARSALLASLAGHDLIREAMPHARMQAPEAP